MELLGCKGQKQNWDSFALIRYWEALLLQSIFLLGNRDGMLRNNSEMKEEEAQKCTNIL